MTPPPPTRTADLRQLQHTEADLTRCVHLPSQVWVGSGRATVSPMHQTTLGVGAFHVPPISAPSFNLRIDLRVNGFDVIDSPGGFRLPEPQNNIPAHRRPLLQQARSWRLDRIRRIGHAHFRDDRGRIISFQITSDLIALHEQAGFAMTLMLRNRCEQALQVTLLDHIEPGTFGRLNWSDWVWQLPAPQASVQHLGERRFRAGDVQLRVAWDDTTLVVAPGQQVVTAVSCVVHEGDRPPCASSIAKLNAQETQRQQQRLETLSAHLPTLATNHAALGDYWRRCLITAMTCQWDFEAFDGQPHVATGGLDGGALCTYLWDVSYAPLLLHLLQPQALPSILDTLQRMDVTKHFAFTPDGRGTGPWYAANDHALTELIWTDAVVRGPQRQRVQFLYDTLLASEQRLPAIGELKDFGSNRNLLEMRSNGYEHAVPCFNSLRAGNLHRLAALMDLVGLPDAESLRRQAATIARAVRQQLWNPQRQWFDCLHPDGSRHSVDSIQVFDVMLAAVATRAQEKALVARLVDGDFLDAFGVHSVSPRDEHHFELVDIDWSGNGAFIGEPPMLACTLWRRGHAGAAWRVLRRLLWMGSRLAYFPQETFAPQAAPGPRGRANCIAALAGARAILEGMIGCQPHPDGSLTLQPRLPRHVEVELRNLRLGEAVIDLRADARQCEVTLNGKTLPPIARGQRCRFHFRPTAMRAACP